MQSITWVKHEHSYMNHYAQTLRGNNLSLYSIPKYAVLEMKQIIQKIHVIRWNYPQIFKWWTGFRAKCEMKLFLHDIYYKIFSAFRSRGQKLTSKSTNLAKKENLRLKSNQGWKYIQARIRLGWFLYASKWAVHY